MIGEKLVKFRFPQGDCIGMKYEVLLYRSLTHVFSVRVPALLVLRWVCRASWVAQHCYLQT